MKNGEETGNEETGNGWEGVGSSIPSSTKSIGVLQSENKNFECPVCLQTFPMINRTDHLCKHFHDFLSADLPNSHPFKCPQSKCHFIATDRESLLSHYGGFHGIVDRCIQDYLGVKVENGDDIVKCRLCPKDSSIQDNIDALYIHLTKTHFRDRLLKGIPPEAKLIRCYHPDCDFTTLEQNSFLAHLPTFHRSEIKYYYQEAIDLQNDEEGLRKSSVKTTTTATATTTAFPKRSNSSSAAPPIPKNNPKSIQICPICSQNFNSDDFLSHMASEHFADALVEDCLPTAPPFKCPICPHFSQNHCAALRHWFIFHNMLEAYTTSHLNRLHDSSLVQTTAATTTTTTTPEEQNQQPLFNGQNNSNINNNRGKSAFHKKMECLMCDDVRIVGSTPLDLHKHLVEKHFRDRLLDLIPSIGCSIDGKPRFCCPFQGCFYEHHYKWIIAKHYGIKHRVAKQFYEEVIGVSKCKPIIDEQTTQSCVVSKVVTAATTTTHATKVSSANQSDYQSVITLKERLQAQSQQLYHRQQQPWQQQQQLLQKSKLHSQQHQQQPPTQHFASRALPNEDQVSEKRAMPTVKEQPPLQPQNTGSTFGHSFSTFSKASNKIEDESFDCEMTNLHDDDDDEDDDEDLIEQSSSAETSFDDSIVSDTPSSSSSFKNYDCQICSVKSKGITEHLKHLSKVHFKHKLLSCVPKSAPYRCPWQDCEVVKKDRFNLALHYGTAHKVALSLLMDMPEDAVNEEMEATCKICHQSFTAHRYLYTHLSDTHFCAELDADLPESAPWKCPKCAYVGNYPRALRIHFGVRHKIVLNHLADSLGINSVALKKEMKAGRKKVVCALKTPVKCKYCQLQFVDVKELLKHNVLHFRSSLSCQLPDKEPFDCPKCEFFASDQLTLLFHYGTAHPEVMKEVDLTQPSEKIETSDGQRTEDLILQRHLEEDKMFPKCRICNYRYFTRLDLCRHFVDFHLRQRIAGCIDPNSHQCPSCSVSYVQPQSRLRHFIWSHQDLERLVMQDFNVRLSEFMPSTRDLEIVKKKCERRTGLEDIDDDFKDLTDLAALPVHEKLDLKLNMSCCELCGEEFKAGVNKARDKSVHLFGHFREEIMKDLPRCKPFKCPKCIYVGKDITDLTKHYGLLHRVIFFLMQKELGDGWDIDDTDTNECQLCGIVFANSRLLSDHYCSQHFYQKLSAGLPIVPPFKCTECHFQCKTQLALVRHIGAKHKLVQRVLAEEGLLASIDLYRDSKSRSSSISQDIPSLQDHHHFNHHFDHQDSSMDSTNYDQSWGNQFTSGSVLQHNNDEKNFHQSDYPDSDSHLHWDKLQESNLPFNMENQQQQEFLEPINPKKLIKTNGNCVKTKKSTAGPIECPICNSPFLTSPQFLRHLTDNHFYDQLCSEFPSFKPFSCPLCNFEGKDRKTLTHHYGISHKVVLKHLNDWCEENHFQDEDLLKTLESHESNHESCPLCKSSFGGRYMLMRHLADCHFRERLSQGFQVGDMFKCPDCNHTSKDKGGFVRHYGLVHKMVQHFLTEMGIHKFADIQQSSKKNEKNSGDFKSKDSYKAADLNFKSITSSNYETANPDKEGPLFNQPSSFRSLPPPPPYVSHSSSGAQPQYYSTHQPTTTTTTTTTSSPLKAQRPFAGHQTSASSTSATPTTFHHSTFSASHVSPSSFMASNNQLSSPSLRDQLLSPHHFGSENDEDQETPTNSNTSVFSTSMDYDTTPINYDIFYSKTQDLASSQPRDLSHGPPPSYYSSAKVSAQQQQHQQHNINPTTTMSTSTSQEATPSLYSPLSVQHDQVFTLSQNQSERFNIVLQPFGQQSLDKVQSSYLHYPDGSFSPSVTPTTDASTPSSNTSQSYISSALYDFIEAPASGVKGPFLIECNFCKNMSSDETNFHEHLTEFHFQNELLRELPRSAPFKCPVEVCSLESHGLGQLLKHYGTVHKAFQPHLHGQMVGRYLPYDLHHQQQQQQQQQVEEPRRHEPVIYNQVPAQVFQKLPEQVIQNVVIKLKCPFCDSTYPSHNDFYVHLCDTHFREKLVEDLPDSSSPFRCPVLGCSYETEESQQHLVYHYGISHKIVFALLKDHVNKTIFQIPSDHSGHQIGSIKYHKDQFFLQKNVTLTSSQDEYLQESIVASNYDHPLVSQQNMISTFDQKPIKIESKIKTEFPNFEPQMDGTFDPYHDPDHKIPDLADDHESFLLSVESETKEEEPSGAMSPMASSLKSSPKLCEICGKIFEGKNRAMLKVQHMAHHFKEKLFADLKDKTPPFRCPMEGCNYQTKHKPDWARHYGSVHQFIPKYLKEYIVEQEAAQKQSNIITKAFTTATPSSSNSSKSSEVKIPGITDGERTYSAFLPKADLNQIISTAITQQSQTGKNFGVVTINPIGLHPPPLPPPEPNLEESATLSFVEQVIRHSTKIDASGMVSQPSPLPDFTSSHHCFLCPAWFQSDEELNEHMSQHASAPLATDQQHSDRLNKSSEKLDIAFMDDLEASLLGKGDSSVHVSVQDKLFQSNPLPNLPILKQTTKPGKTTSKPPSSTSSTTGAGTLVPNRSTGRPCEVCGFEPKTKNKSRERQDHLAMKHYRERIQGDLAATQSYRCPLCDYNGKDKQTIYRHYTGKHKVVEQYLADDIAAGRIIPLAQQQFQEQLQQQQQQQQQQLHRQVQQVAHDQQQQQVQQHLPHNHQQQQVQQQLTQEQQQQQQQQHLSNGHDVATDSFQMLTNFDLSGNTSVVDTNGLDLSVHSLVDSRLTLAEFMDVDDPHDDVTNPLSDVTHQVDEMHDDDLDKYDKDSIDESMIF